MANIDAIREFDELDASQVSVLWLSPDPGTMTTSANEANVQVYPDRTLVAIPTPRAPTGRARLICSKPSLILGCLLAEGYENSRGDFDERRLVLALDRAAERLAMRTREDPFRLESEGPSGLIQDLAHVMMELHERARFPIAAPPPELAFEGARRADAAMKALQKRGLVVDPPWLGAAGYGALVLLAGVVPLDICVKTTRGKQLVKEVSLKAPLWEFERQTSDEGSSWHFKVKLADFVGRSLARLARRYIQYWSKHGEGKSVGEPAPSGLSLDSDGSDDA